MSAGVYQINIGPFFYIGSSKNMKCRACNHFSDLKHGRHRNHRTQAAFATHGNATWKILHPVPFEWGETETSLKAKLFVAEQSFISAHHGTEHCLNISSTSIGTTCPRPDVAARWNDPNFRAKAAANKDRVPTNETRAKMTKAKLGGRNPKAREVTLSFEGSDLSFDCASAAARHFGVSQQVMEGWLAGRFPWPGDGIRVSRAALHLVGLRGAYAQSK